jgi:Fe2+ or Zn2+ uptake regulation protein
MSAAASVQQPPRQSGLPRRQTKQRALIWDVLAASNGDHLSVAEVEAAVRAVGSPLHRATVYRTLDRLVEDGLLVRTNLGLEGAQYEIVQAGHHHHLVCEYCRKVEHVPHQAVRSAIRRIESTSGFDLTEAELSLEGRCRDCQPR